MFCELLTSRWLVWTERERQTVLGSNWFRASGFKERERTSTSSGAKNLRECVNEMLTADRGTFYFVSHFILSHSVQKTFKPRKIFSETLRINDNFFWMITTHSLTCNSNVHTSCMCMWPLNFLNLVSPCSYPWLQLSLRHHHRLTGIQTGAEKGTLEHLRQAVPLAPTMQDIDNTPREERGALSSPLIVLIPCFPLAVSY